MEKNGEFIENETEIQAVCNAYNVTVVLTSHDAGHDKVVEPTGGADAETRTIYVAHYNQLHYVAIAKGGAVMGQAVPNDHGAAPVDGDGDSDSGSDYGGDGDGDSDPDDRGDGDGKPFVCALLLLCVAEDTVLSCSNTHSPSPRFPSPQPA